MTEDKPSTFSSEFLPASHVLLSHLLSFETSTKALSLLLFSHLVQRPNGKETDAEVSTYGQLAYFCCLCWRGGRQFSSLLLKTHIFTSSSKMPPFTHIRLEFCIASFHKLDDSIYDHILDVISFL